MKTEWTKKEVAEIVGLTPRTIQFYTDEGIIVPGKYAPVGRGTTRKYSAKNLVEFAVVSELSRCGLSLSDIKQVMNSGRLLESAGGDPWDPHNLLTKKRHFVILYDPHAEHGTMVMQGAKDFEIKLTFGPKIGAMRKTPFKSAVVVDITSITERIRSLI